MAQVLMDLATLIGFAIASVCMRVPPTVSVDNFVEKAVPGGRKTAPIRGGNKMLKF